MPRPTMDLLDYNLGANVRAFSTLRSSGGRGKGAYAAFNITHYCGDAPENVAFCRQQLCNELGIADDHLLLPRQTHTDRVAIIDDSYFALSHEERTAAIDQCDALVTKLPNVCIGISTADCVPLLLHDPEAGIVAAVHAGWRGMVARIPQRTIETMTALGAHPHRIRVAIGPSIGPASFEVGEEVVAAFAEAAFPDSIVLRGFRRPHIDLWAAATYLLEESGVDLMHLLVAGVDTFTTDDSFFSARRLDIHSGRTFTGILITSLSKGDNSSLIGDTLDTPTIDYSQE